MENDTRAPYLKIPHGTWKCECGQHSWTTDKYTLLRNFVRSPCCNSLPVATLETIETIEKLRRVKRKRSFKTTEADYRQKQLEHMQKVSAELREIRIKKLARKKVGAGTGRPAPNKGKPTPKEPYFKSIEARKASYERMKAMARAKYWANKEKDKEDEERS